MVLKVEVPLGYEKEQAYIARCLLRDFLGLEHEVTARPIQRVLIHDGDGRELSIAADLFTRPSHTWLTAGSLPREPLAWWNADIPARLIDRRLPVLYGT